MKRQEIGVDQILFVQVCKKYILSLDNAVLLSQAAKRGRDIVVSIMLVSYPSYA